MTITTLELRELGQGYEFLGAMGYISQKHQEMLNKFNLGGYTPELIALLKRSKSI